MGVHVWNMGEHTFAHAKQELTLSMITRTSTLMVSAGEHEGNIHTNYSQGTSKTLSIHLNI